MVKDFFSIDLVCDVLSLGRSSINKMLNDGELVADRYDENNKPLFHIENLIKFDEFRGIHSSKWAEHQLIKPVRDYKTIELFAGCGGMALGLHQAGFNPLLLNEFDKNACKTLRINKPEWDVVEGDIANVDFRDYQGEVDLLAGGFPCQAFSYAGRQMGFNDTRGTLFFEYARAIKEIQPKLFLAENVKGLLTHDSGRTFETIKGVVDELGYTLIECDLYKAMFYKVPQKRERLILIGIRNDLYVDFGKCFEKPPYYEGILTFNDAMGEGCLFDSAVKESPGVVYSAVKKKFMDHVPEGGNWRDLPHALQREYMAGSFEAGGGKTGMARRLHRNRPSLTLTCSPAQKQTERCHPIETRPLQIQEYSRLQTFPDDWIIEGALTNKYKQIGNAVPVNLAKALGLSLISLLNKINNCTKD